jgi:SAM-dependent methyltransferase
LKAYRFDGLVELDSRPPLWWGLLTVTAVHQTDPTIRRTLGVALIRRVHGSRRQMPRHAYKAIWDEVSVVKTDALYAVAGTADTSELQRSGASTATDVASETELQGTDRVLEIGCGVGRVGIHLAPRCRHWVGADVSPHMLEHARRALADLDNVSFCEIDGIDLRGFDDSTFDVVYCTAVFMHIDEWERFRYIREAYRVLKPMGRVYADNFCLTSREGWRLFEQTARLDPASRPPQVSKSSTAEELEMYARMAGFSSIRIRRGELFVTLIAQKPHSSR